MKIVQIAEPSVEPVSLQEIKEHLRLDSGDFADNIDTTQSIAPASQTVTVGYALEGTGVDVLTYESIVNLNSGTNEATGTVDVKIQDSDDDITYTDWAGGAFTQVTTANDNAIFEKEYTGGRQYVRAVAQILLADCVFSVDVVRRNTAAVDDSYLTTLITSAREYVEGVSWRRLITQTIDIYLNSFTDPIVLPFGNLQTVTTVKYTESDGTSNTISSDDYIVETNGEDKGKVVLAYETDWPDAVLYPSNLIQIRFICGYGDAGSDVPEIYRSAIKLVVGGWYSNRESQTDKPLSENKSVLSLLNTRRLF